MGFAALEPWRDLRAAYLGAVTAETPAYALASERMALSFADEATRQRRELTMNDRTLRHLARATFKQQRRAARRAKAARILAFIAWHDDALAQPFGLGQ